jgi:hypothetical protein
MTHVILDAADEIRQENAEAKYAADVLARIAGEQSSDATSDDLTVPLAIKLSQTEQSLSEAKRALLLFRTFALQNATQWKAGCNHHHPIWQLVAETLGDMNEHEVRDGKDWRLIQPLDSVSNGQQT